jgi:hypothetical protein
MTLNELAEHYFHGWKNGSFTIDMDDHEIAARGDDVADMFIEEARSRALACEEDIQAEAGTLAEAIDETVAGGR